MAVSIGAVGTYIATAFGGAAAAGTAGGVAAGAAAGAGAAAAGTAGLTALEAAGVAAAGAAATAGVSAILAPGAPKEKLGIPMPDSKALEEAKKRSIAEQIAQRGRASTIMTETSGKLGG